LPMVRRCGNRIPVVVDVRVGGGRPPPFETRCIYPPHLFPLALELNGCRCGRGRERTGLREVSPAGVENDGARQCIPAPDDHFTARPYCRVPKASAIRRVGSGGSFPTVAPGIVSPAALLVPAPAFSPPANHLTTPPHSPPPPPPT